MDDDLNPGPSAPGGVISQVVPPDFLRSSYAMAIADPAKVATIKQFLEGEKVTALQGRSPNQKIIIGTRFDFFINKIGQPFDNLFSFLGKEAPQRVNSYRTVLEKAITFAQTPVNHEDASAPASDPLNETISTDPAGGKRITDPEAYKKKALDTLKERNITPMMVYTALLTKKIYKGQKVVSKMFNFKTWGHITNDHVFEVKSKNGQLFRYKIGYQRKNQNYHSLLAKAPGSFYTQIFTHRAHGYDSDREYEEGFQRQEKRQLTRKLKLKPRYRTRKNKH
jgi:hypothetical protein